MPRSSGGAQNLRRGDRVRIYGGYHVQWLRGLVGEVTCVLHHGVIVALDSDPVRAQRVIGTAGAVGPKVPNRAQRTFQFNEVERVDP